MLGCKLEEVFLWSIQCCSSIGEYMMRVPKRTKGNPRSRRQLNKLLADTPPSRRRASRSSMSNGGAEEQFSPGCIAALPILIDATQFAADSLDIGFGKDTCIAGTADRFDPASLDHILN